MKTLSPAFIPIAIIGLAAVVLSGCGEESTTSPIADELDIVRPAEEAWNGSDDASQVCYPDLPELELRVSGQTDFEQDGVEWVRYTLAVQNVDKFPNSLFQKAPEEFPRCSRDLSAASRTYLWILASNGLELGFDCEIESRDDLRYLHFTIRADAPQPTHVFVQLYDRVCRERYRSNLATTGVSSELKVERSSGF